VKSYSTFDEASTFCTNNNLALLWVDANLRNDFLKYAETLVDATNKKMWIYDGSDTCSMMTYTNVFTIATQECSEPVWSFCEYKKDQPARKVRKITLPLLLIECFLNLLIVESHSV
jgi:hypothetical protein